MPLGLRRRALLPLLACPLALVAAAPAHAQEAGKTRVYVVVVDGLRPDEVALMPFLSSLAAAGSYYQESRAVMVAETIPNHVAMVTGTYPDKNGIVANDFPDVTDDTTKGNEDVGFLSSDSIFTLVQEQCPDLVAASVTSKDYLFEVMDHDRTGDGVVDADSNFDNTSDPTFIPVAGLTPDERTIAEATLVSQQADPDFMFLNLGSVDRVGHADVTGGPFVEVTGMAPIARSVQRTLTDTYLRAFVEQLQADGRWDSTAFIVTADHSMDWSLPTSTVSLSDAFAAEPLLADQLVIAQNGGAALYSLKDRSAPESKQRLAKMREIAVATEGVAEALYREPNPLDGGNAHWVGAVHPDWHQTGARSGDLLVTVEDGLRISEPDAMTSNPLPGNHGMPSTLRIPVIVSGGIGVEQRTVTGDADPFVRAADQAENVDMAPTAAYLLGVDPPAAGFDGRALSEAFTARPADACVTAAAGVPPVAVPGTGTPPGGAPAPVTGTGGRGGLASTGAPIELPLLGLAGVGLALAVRRRSLRGSASR